MTERANFTSNRIYFFNNIASLTTQKQTALKLIFAQTYEQSIIKSEETVIILIITKNSWTQISKIDAMKMSANSRNKK